MLLTLFFVVIQLQSTGSLAPGTIGKILSGRGVKRGDDISSGGRLSRRNADPIAEAERKAQQEKLYSLDLDRVLAGQRKRVIPDVLCSVLSPSECVLRKLAVVEQAQFPQVFAGLLSAMISLV